MIFYRSYYRMKRKRLFSPCVNYAYLLHNNVLVYVLVLIKSISFCVDLREVVGLRQRCHVSYVTGASYWDWFTVGQGLLSLQQVRVKGECFYFFCFFTFIHFPISPLSFIYLLLFSGRRHKMTHKDWRAVKPQHNQIMTKTYLYNFDPLKPHFYTVKLGITGVYIIFLISAQKHRLWVLVRTASTRRF